jgi:RNA polymerase sigma-70 factor (ECF subfamily)
VHCAAGEIGASLIAFVVAGARRQRPAIPMERAEFDPDVERAFVASLLARDAGQLDRLTDRLGCVPRMLALRNARMGNPLDEAELEDVVQDTVVAVLRKLPEYEPLAPLESWIHGICCLQIRTALRLKRRWRQRARELSADAAELRAPDRLGELEDLAEVHDLLGHLAPLEADVLRLKHMEGMTFAELAPRLRIAPGTAKTFYYRALAALRELLQRQRGEERSA